MRTLWTALAFFLLTSATLAQQPSSEGSAAPPPSQHGSELPYPSDGLAEKMPQQLLQHAHTLYISSNTVFLPVATLTRALLRQKQWSQLNLLIVQSPKLADLQLQIDRIVFTHIHTFVLSDTTTSIVLGSGRQTAFDGNLASGGLAKEIVALLAAARLPPETKP